MEPRAEFFPELASPIAAELNQDEEFDFHEEFDLAAFFSQPLTPEENQRGEQQKDLIVALHDESDKAIATFTSHVSAETFGKGATMAAGIFSSLSNLIGACGALCFHGLGSAGSSLGSAGAHGLGGHGLGEVGSGLNLDSHGNVHLTSSLDSLSRATGLSKHDLLSGKYSAEGILAAFMNSMGKGVSALFGFSIIETLFDSLIPTPQTA